MSLGENITDGASVEKLLLHLNGNANDDSGNGSNGTATNVSYGLAYGKFNEGAYFAGNNGNRISFLTNTLVSNFTYSAWIYLTENNSVRTIISGYSLQSGNGCTQFRIESNGRLGLIKSYVVAVGYSTGTLPTNTWCYVVCTYASGGAYKFYNNAVLIGSGTNNQAFTQRPLLVGTNSEIGNWYEPYKGYIDEIRIRSRVLTQQEIQKEYTHGLGRF